MTDTTEPTEEQRRAAASICRRQSDDHWGEADERDIARLLAEREAKLREHSEWLTTQCSKFEDANISNRETIKALNEENQRYCEQVAIEKRHYSILNKIHEQTTADLDAARADNAFLRNLFACIATECDHVGDIDPQVKRVRELEACLREMSDSLIGVCHDQREDGPCFCHWPHDGHKEWCKQARTALRDAHDIMTSSK